MRALSILELNDVVDRFADCSDSLQHQLHDVRLDKLCNCQLVQ